MGRPDTLDEKRYGQIVTLMENGLDQNGIADIMGVSIITVQRIARAEKAAKAGDLADMRKLSQQSGRIAQIACDKYKLNLNAQPHVEVEPEEKQDNTAQAFMALLEAVKDLAKQVSNLDNRLSQMQMTIQGARTEATEHNKKLVETVNVNGDILTKEYQELRDRLEAIKINTKRMVRQ